MSIKGGEYYVLSPLFFKKLNNIHTYSFMEKILLTWNKDTQKYFVRTATSEDLKVLKEINTLMKSIKSFYYQVIEDASQEHMAIDTFIDNESYCAWCNACKDARKVDELAAKIGISFDVNRYIHWF